jgi:hypothetical protein
MLYSYEEKIKKMYVHKFCVFVENVERIIIIIKLIFRYDYYNFFFGYLFLLFK